MLIVSSFCRTQSIETLDGGKLFADAVDDMTGTVDVLRYYAGWADKVQGKTIPAGESVCNSDYHSPLEVILLLLL